MIDLDTAPAADLEAAIVTAQAIVAKKFKGTYMNRHGADIAKYVVSTKRALRVECLRDRSIWGKTELIQRNAEKIVATIAAALGEVAV